MTIQPDEDLEGLWWPVTVVQNSDATIDLAIVQPGTGLPYDLTGCDVEVVVKPSRYVSDAAGTTYNAVVDADPTTGRATLTIEASNLAAFGTFWYHVDVTAGAASITVIIGPFDIQAA